MNILEITGEPIGTGGQEMFIINVLRHINMKDLKIDLLTPYYCENEIYREEVVKIRTNGTKVHKEEALKRKLLW